MTTAKTHHNYFSNSYGLQFAYNTKKLVLVNQESYDIVFIIPPVIQCAKGVVISYKRLVQRSKPAKDSTVLIKFSVCKLLNDNVTYHCPFQLCSFTDTRDRTALEN